MHHPNRSQSSPSLRFNSKQGLDYLVPSRSNSMPNSEPSTYTSSIRRLGSRRPRPSVASIADVFVSSLVMASFCREHSPRGRGLSTMSIAASQGEMSRWQSRGMAGNRQLQSRTRLDLSTSQAEYLRMQPPKVRRLFTSQAAQSVGVGSNEGENNKVKDDSSRGPRAWKTEEDSTSTATDLRRDRMDSWKSLPPRQHDDLFKDDAKYLAEGEDVYDNDIRETAILDNETPSTTESGKRSYPTWISPAQKQHAAVSQLYNSTLDTEIDWKEAVELVAGDVARSSMPVTIPQAPSRGRKVMGRDAVEIPSVEEFLNALWDETKSNQYIFRLYRELPFPGVSHLSKASRGALLRRFANPPDRRRVDARRFLALVDDMVAAGLPLSRSLWTSAIYMAGRPQGKIFKRDLIKAIGIWHQMEHWGQIESDDVVFNTLFDIAVKAGQYTVADRLLEEMKNRGISFSRAGKVSMIYYHGSLQDIDGIRQAFNEFVESGEIIDTVVMNCLMTAFLRTGDVRTAEQLYGRMMETQALWRKKYGPRDELFSHPSLSTEFSVYRRKAKEIHRALRLSPALKEKLPEYHRALQESMFIIPDTRTFHILLKYHAHESGNLRQFMSILRDMERTFPIPPRGMVYLFLFEGFVRHGGKKRHWSADRLRDVWQAYLRALYDSKRRLEDLINKRKDSLHWENPLAKHAASIMDGFELPATPSGHYMPLPSNVPHVDAETGKDQKKETAEEDEAETEKETETDLEIVEADSTEVDEIFSRGTLSPQSELEELEQRVENGVFLGRRMIITILRAFGACCRPQEVMDAWLKIEEIWQPKKRRAADVLAVNEEVERHMSKLKGRV